MFFTFFLFIDTRLCLCLMITFWPCCHRKTLHLIDDRGFFSFCCCAVTKESEELELPCCSQSLSLFLPSLGKNETSFNVTHFSLLAMFVEFSFFVFFLSLSLFQQYFLVFSFRSNDETAE